MVESTSARAARIALIGAPAGVGAGVPGSEGGPRAMRAAGLARALAAAGADVEDRGDVPGPERAEEPVEQGCKNLTQVLAWCQAAKAAVGEAIAQGRAPVLLGGDHSLALGSIAAVSEACSRSGRGLRVLWLDAHADFNDPSTSPSGNVHGMPLAALTRSGPQAARAVAAPGALRAEQARILGARDVDPGEREELERWGVRVMPMAELRALGARAAAAEALAGMAPGDWLHVSFDLDFLDPAAAAGVGTPVDGGPSMQEARELMAAIGAARRVDSADCVELNPELDPGGASARACVELLALLWGADARAPLA